MSFSIPRVNVINLFAENFDATKAFYENILGLSLAFEDETTAVFTLENVIICLTAVSAAPDLISPRAVASPDAGSRFILSMFVDDVDAQCSELTALGVELLNGPVDRPWGVRTANFVDPAGHIWQIGQDLDAE